MYKFHIKQLNFQNLLAIRFLFLSIKLFHNSVLLISHHLKKKKECSDFSARVYARDNKPKNKNDSKIKLNRTIR